MSTNTPPNNTEPTTVPHTSDPSDPLSEELPPAYTAVADITHGETSVQFGPRRPFQPAPPPPQPQSIYPNPYTSARWQPQHRPATSGWQSSWSGYPGQLHRSSTSASTSTSMSNRPPPPRHPTQSHAPQDDFFPGPSRRPPPSSLQTQTPTPTGSSSSPSYAPPPGPPPPSSLPETASPDFVRDFYSSGTGSTSTNTDTALLGGTSDQYSPSHSRSAEDVSSSPRHLDSSTTHGGGGRGEGSAIPDDGRPTEKPVPGHPLLNNGRVLVYPAGHECAKCQNTGYKHYDPSHPCTKCWQKYSKPFAGPIAYAPWGSSPSPSLTTTTSTPSSSLNLQRPLRMLGQGHRSTTSLPPFSSLSSSTTTNTSTYPGLARSSTSATRPSFPPPTWGTSPPSSSYPYQQQRGTNTRTYTPISGPPPPGALVVKAGDPRLGGRLCWRCDGTGTVSLFFFDQSTCDVCGGMGRVFN